MAINPYGAQDPYGQGQYGQTSVYSQDQYGAGGVNEPNQQVQQQQTQWQSPTQQAPSQQTSTQQPSAPPPTYSSPVTGSGTIAPPQPGQPMYQPAPGTGGPSMGTQPVGQPTYGQPVPAQQPQGQQQPPQQPDTSNWDTDGYQQPQWTATNFAGAPPPGWDAEKWTNPNHQTPKYVVGRILSQYNLMDESQRQAAIQDIMRAYPGTTQVSDDKINFPGIGLVDIFGDVGGQNRPQWLDIAADERDRAAQQQQSAQALSGQAPVNTGTVGGGGGGGGANTTSPDYSGLNQQILAQLQQLMANPELFDAQNIAQMKEAQKEFALQQQADALQNYTLGAASRGVLGSGYDDTFSRRMNDSTQENILGAYRDIDLRVPEQNRNALLQAIAASHGVQLDNRGLDLQGELGRGDLALRNRSLNEQIRQFDTMTPYQQAQIENSILMSRLGYGQGLANMQLGAQGGLLEWLSQQGLA